jgi:hypothetical protein
MNQVLDMLKNIIDNYRKIAVPIIIIVIVILGYLLYYQGQRVKKYQKDLELLDQEIAQKKSEIDERVGLLEGQQKSLINRFADLSIAISDQIFSDQIGKDFFKFIDDPKGRRLYREQQRIIINETYKDFFNEINLNDTEIDELKDLLVDKQMVNLEIIVSLLKGDMTKQQIADNDKKFNDIIVNADKNLRDFFEDDEFDLFEDYNLSLQYRNWILDFKNHLAQKEIFIDQEQEYSLLDLIINEAEDFDFSDELQLPELKNADEFSEADRAKINRYLDEREELDEIIVEKSRYFFNTEEVAALEVFLKLRRNMDEMGFEVTSNTTPKNKTER